MSEPITDTQRTDLTACPFCKGHEDEEASSVPIIYNGHDEFTDEDDRGNPPYYVQCSYCLSRGPTADNPIDARDWWNDRPREGSVNEQIADTQRIDFIGSLEQGICQLSMPGDIAEGNLTLRNAIDACIELEGGGE